MSLASFTQELDRLVSNFDRNKAFHSSKDFQESQLRVDFVSPLFEALGWDVSNRAGNPPHLREVVVESRVEEKGHRRRADYTFQVSGQPRLVVETKRPSEDLEDPKHILQLKKYAWNLQVRFAVLTNFLQTKIYAVPAPPVLTQPNEFLLEQVEFLQYLAKPDLLYGLLSKERVLEGALDKYFETIPKHKRDKAYQRSLFRLRGSKMVDDHFLDDLMEFRRDLARDIVQRNSRAGLTEPEVNEAVQRVIDRIVFLRIGEDRGIIYDPTLLDLVEKWGSKGSRVSFYPRLVEHFAGFNRPYNGLLFKHHSLSEGLDLSDEVLAGFIERISVETSPYRFDVIPVEILGSIYERFLGSVVRITPARVKVEEKPEVRKAGGVYYTPKYIVDYIVDQTVGKLMEGRTPEQVAGLRVLDPACGSGSFLLGAFTKIMEYLVEWFHRNPKASGKYGEWFYLDETASVRLTPYAKRHILLNNLYGVDIDPQACEVTQLSLYLKLLEGESKESLREHQLKAHAEAFLPDLRNNIKCGNSLIASDFSLVPEDLMRVKAFDWPVQFHNIMEAGGFDAVIGNPPYVYGRDWSGLGISGDQKKYFSEHFSASPYQLDMFSLFMERAIFLTSKAGTTGQIVPNVWLTNQFSKTTRQHVFSKLGDLAITAAPSDAFGRIVVDTVVYTGLKGLKSETFTLKSITPRGVELIGDFPCVDYRNGDKPITTTASKEMNELTQRLIRSFCSLGSITEMTRGVHPYRDDGFGQSAFGKGFQTQRDVDERPYHSATRKTGWRPFIYGKDLYRFLPPKHTEFVKYGKWLAEPRDPRFFAGPRVYSRKILGERLIVTYEDKDTVADQQVYITKPINAACSAKYLVGILGSKLVAFFIRAYFDEYTKAFPQIKVSQLREIPVPLPSVKVRHDRLVALVDKMLALMPKLREARTDAERATLQNAVTATDRQIDLLVYKLYGLTKEEIKLVEKSCL